MQSLATGESPVVAVRIPEDLLAELTAAAGSHRGARAQYIRAVLADHFRRETARSMQSPGRSQRATTMRKGTH